MHHLVDDISFDQFKFEISSGPGRMLVVTSKRELFFLSTIMTMLLLLLLLALQTYLGILVANQHLTFSFFSSNIIFQYLELVFL
jgi:hypothetical protein